MTRAKWQATRRKGVFYTQTFSRGAVLAYSEIEFIDEILISERNGELYVHFDINFKSGEKKQQKYVIEPEMKTVSVSRLFRSNKDVQKKMGFRDYADLLSTEEAEEKCEAYKAAKSDHAKLTARFKKYCKLSANLS